eukprot:363857-Chlamydomonas_euryale.AAC.4
MRQWEFRTSIRLLQQPSTIYDAITTWTMAMTFAYEWPAPQILATVKLKALPNCQNSQGRTIS